MFNIWRYVLVNTCYKLHVISIMNYHYYNLYQRSCIAAHLIIESQYDALVYVSFVIFWLFCFKILFQTNFKRNISIWTIILFIYVFFCIGYSCIYFNFTCFIPVMLCCLFIDRFNIALKREVWIASNSGSTNHYF